MFELKNECISFPLLFGSNAVLLFLVGGMQLIWIDVIPVHTLAEVKLALGRNGLRRQNEFESMRA